VNGGGEAVDRFVNEDFVQIINLAIGSNWMAMTVLVILIRKEFTVNEWNVYIEMRRKNVLLYSEAQKRSFDSLMS
jgi:hypothetical protein